MFKITGFKCRPVFALETEILERNTGAVQNQTRKFSSSSDIEVVEFVARHFSRHSDNISLLSLEKRQNILRRKSFLPDSDNSWLIRQTMCQNTTRHLTEQKRTEPKTVRSTFEKYLWKCDKHKAEIIYMGMWLIKADKAFKLLSESDVNLHSSNVQKLKIKSYWLCI